VIKAIDGVLDFMHKLLKAKALPPAKDEERLTQARRQAFRDETPSKAQRRQGLWVTSVGYCEGLRAHRAIRRRVIDRFAAVYISRGSGFFESAPTGRCEIQAGTLFWLVPGVAHSYSPGEGGWDEHWIVFGGSLAQELHRQGMLTPTRPVQVGHDADFLSLAEKIETTFLQGGPLSVALCAGLIYQLIVTVHGLSTGLLRMDQNLDPAIGNVLRIIEAEAPQGLQPWALARRVHVGYSTLRRKFKRQTGYSVKEYMLRQQLRHAKELLVASGQSIEEISRAIGIENSLYFSRLFKKKEGAPPTQYRRRYRENAGMK